MKQKFSLKTIAVSFIAIGLMLTAVTSCKDYDKDIEDLRKDITANTKDIAATKSALEAFKNSGKLVKEVKPITNGIQLVFTDGTSYDVKNGVDGEKGEDGKDGKDGKDGTVVEVKDGVLHVNGEATDIKANSGSELKVEVKDGELYINGEATGIKKPALTAVKGDGVITFTFADGSKAVVPLATSKLNSIVFVPNYTNGGNEALLYTPRFQYLYVETKGAPNKSDVGLNPWAHLGRVSSNATTNYSEGSEVVNHSRPKFKSAAKPMNYTKGYKVEIDVNPTNFDISNIKSLDFESKEAIVLTYRGEKAGMQILKNADGTYMINPVAGIPGRYEIMVNGKTPNATSYNGHIRINGDHTGGKVEKLQLSATLGKDADGKDIKVLSDWVTPYSPEFCVWPIIARDYQGRGEKEIDTPPSLSYNQHLAYQGDFDMVAGPNTFEDMLEVSVPVRNEDNTVNVMDLRKVVKLIERPTTTIANAPRNTTHNYRDLDVQAACCDPVQGGGSDPHVICDDVVAANHGKELKGFVEGFGLHYRFYLMEHTVYDQANSGTKQHDYVKLINPKKDEAAVEYTLGEIQAYDRVGGGTENAAIGRSPIFQVRLVDDKGKVYALSYIRLKFVPKHVTPKVWKTATYEEIVFTECKPTAIDLPANDERRKYKPEGKYDGVFISTYDWTNDNIYTKGPFAALGGIDTQKFTENYIFNQTQTTAANAPGNSIDSECYSGELFDVSGLIDGGISENNTGTDLFRVAKKATCARAGEYLVAVVFTRTTEDVRYPATVIVKAKIVVKDFNDGNFWNYTTDTDAGKRVSGYWLTTKKDDTFEGTTHQKNVIVAKGEPVFDYNQAGTIASPDYKGVLPKINLLNGFKSDFASTVTPDDNMLNNLRAHITGAYDYKFEFDTDSEFADNISDYNATITASVGLTNNENKSVVSLDEFPKTNTFIPVKLVVNISDALDSSGNPAMKQTNNNGEVCWCHTYEKTFLIEFRNPAKVEGHIILSDVPTTDQYIDLTDLKKMIAVGDIHSNTIHKSSYWRVAPQYGPNVGSANHYFAETHSNTSFTFYPANDASTHYFEVAGGNVHGIATPTTVMDAVNVTDRPNDSNTSTQLADLKYVKWLTSAVPGFAEHTLRFELRKTPNTQDYPVAVKAINLASPTAYNTLATGSGLKPVFLYYGSQQGHAALTQDQDFFIDVWGYYGSGDEVTANLTTPSLGETKATAKYYYGTIKVTIKKSE